MARKVSPVLKYAIGGIIVLGIFVFMFRQTAGVFQPKARGQDDIRLFRGRSNYSGTFNQNVHGLSCREILANKVYNITLTVYEVKHSNGFIR